MKNVSIKATNLIKALIFEAMNQPIDKFSYGLQNSEAIKLSNFKTLSFEAMK
jgi:hypothetical protein